MKFSFLVGQLWSGNAARMNILIVYAHPEPASFNAAMTARAAELLGDAGHKVVISDLYAQNFDPVSDRRNFIGMADPGRFDQQVEERAASAPADEHVGFAPDIQSEIEKLRAADLVIFQFPLWWLGMPAIMKGWIDRVFAIGVAYGGGRWFDRGALSGKKAMLSVTIGGPADAYSNHGIYGPIDAVLHPIHRGVLGFVGFQIIEPFIVYGPGRMSTGERALILDQFAQKLSTIDTAPTLPMVRSDEYQNFVRKDHHPL